MDEVAGNPPSQTVRLRAWTAVRGAVADNKLAEIVALVLTMRLALGLFAALSLTMRAADPAGGNWADLVLSPDQPGYMLIAPWQRWDALWYQKVAIDGYAGVDGAAAFFPLFPLLIRAVGTILGGNLALGGLVVSTLCSIAALAVLWRLAARELGPQVADRTILYLMVFPTAFFLLAPFTESVFLLVAITSMYGARTGRWWLAAIAGLLAGVTRNQGAFLALPLLFEYVRQNRRPSVSAVLRAVTTGFPVLGWVGFTSYTMWIGGAKSPGAVMSIWGYQTRAPWDVIQASWQHIATRGDATEALNLAALVVFSIAAFAMVGRLPFSYFLYVMPQLALLTTRQMWFSPLMSTSRYVLVLFPVFILLAVYTPRPQMRQAVAILFLVLQALYFYQFVHWGFVG